LNLKYWEPRRVIKGNTILAVFSFLSGHTRTGTPGEAGGLDELHFDISYSLFLGETAYVYVVELL